MLERRFKSPRMTHKISVITFNFFVGNLIPSSFEPPTRKPDDESATKFQAPANLIERELALMKFKRNVYYNRM